MRTAIFTNDNTTLSIRTFEELHLVQMRPDGTDGARNLLNAGENAVKVGSGVFKILSTRDVRVTGENGRFGAMSDSTKDDGWPDPAKLSFEVAVRPDVLHAFFASAKDLRAPE